MCTLLDVVDAVYIAGEVAILSLVDSFDKAVKASGKFGGVAGVLAGVHSG